jgi:hypothetical protein
MSGQWNPYAREHELEQKPREAAQNVDAEDIEMDTKAEHRFRRRVD